MPALVQLAYRLRRLLLGALRLRTRGVKVMVFNRRGELLLVRHAYVNRDLFLLPGGGVARSETPQAAAAREVREELGLAVTGLALVSTHFSVGEGRRDSIHLFRAEAEADPKPDGIEVVEARYFPLRSLPANVSPATLRRIAEYSGEREPDGRW